MFIVVAYLYFGLFPGIVSGCLLTDYALEFPNKTVTDFVHIWGMPSLKQFTVCFWMKSSDSTDGTPFSYAVPEADNELLIAKYNNFAVWVGDEKRQLSVSANDDKWHHICVSWENTAGLMNLYKDGVLSANATNFKAGHVIRSGGSLMLGQEQDSFASGLDSTQSFQGFLSNLNVWDYVVCQEIITRMSKACISGKGNVYQWSNFKQAFVGEPRLFIPSPCVPPAAVPSKEINDCASDPCLNNGTCTDLVNGFNCSCPPEFTGDRCEADVDECATGLHSCHSSRASCTNTVGSYNCSCNPPYAGDGRTCNLTTECQNYQSLTSANRKVTYTRGFNCDHSIGPGWFRFEGAAGTRMPSSCPPIERCATSAPSWLTEEHPSVSDGAVTKKVCFPWTGGCCEWSTNIKVRNCSSYYVYYLDGTPNKQCYLRYCGTD